MTRLAILTSILAAAWACSNGGDGDGDDAAAADAIDDAPEETALDVSDEAQDAASDVVEEPECLYPTGPYDFVEKGDIAGPMAWPSSIKGEEELMDLEHADLERFFCDPGIQSVVVFIAASWCPFCPDRADNIAGLKEHYDEYGAKLVWVLGDADSSEDARDYFVRNDATYGWYTNDADNTLGANTISGSSMLLGVPWIFVIDAETMEIVSNGPTSVYSITMDLYED
jgi:thiol-disulfide isomerase/thioredoxin